MDNHNVITKLENTLGVKAIQSEAKNVFYFFDDEQKGLLILSFRSGEKNKYDVIGLNKNQAYALADEIRDVCDMIFKK